LHGYLLLSAIVLGAWCAIDLIRGELSLQAYRRARAHWPQLTAVALRLAVWLLMAVAVDVAMPVEQFRHQGESPTKGWCAAGVLMLIAVLPRRRRWAPGDVLFGVLLVVLGVDLNRALSDRADGALDVMFPFWRPSYVLNGGGGRLLNEHARYSGWAGATDLFPVTFQDQVCSGKGLAAYPCFGAPVLAPVSGRVARVVNDRPDMPLGEVDDEVSTGNSLSIQTSDGRYLLLAYLKHSTILVSEGDLVTAGQEIARCGNSGAARVPHLLLQAQDRPGPLEEGQGGRVFSLRFIKALRRRAEDFREGPFVVRRNDTIYPLDLDEVE